MKNINSGKKRSNEFKKWLSKSRVGEGNPMYGKKHSKLSVHKIKKALTNKHGKRVGQLSEKGDIIREFESAHQVERDLGFNFGSICRVCRGERKTAFGFKWIYLDK
ncbi:MAG: NUMOD3 domain-containing DNA-binding protein [bacterium]|nr:NUMOD3 domain-containing DNA-binding protein [bacterium]